MKHLSIQSILSKRKQSRVISRSLITHKEEQKQHSHKFIDISDSAVHNMIETAKDGQPFTQELKLAILEIISKKCNLVLNKNIVAPHMTLLHCSNLVDLTEKCIQKRESFFLLEGEIRVYQEEQNNQTGLEFHTEPFRSSSEDQKQKIKELTFEQFEVNNQKLRVDQTYEVFGGLGQIFRSKLRESTKTRVLGCGVVLVDFKQIGQDLPLYSEGLLLQQKMELISYFPVLRVMGRKLVNFVNGFKLKNFNFKDLIYKKDDSPQSVYFIIEGAVSFELQLDQDKQDQPGSTVSVCSVSSKNYFGEQEIMFKSTSRHHTAKVISSNCVTLQLSKDKFEKMLENSQFNELIHKTSKLKQIQRQKNIVKAKQLLKVSEQKQSKEQGNMSSEELKYHTGSVKNETKRRFSTVKTSSEKVKIMHGNLIRDAPVNNQKVTFSMLEVNPDHFTATKDKYRQFFVQKPAQVIPQPRSFKKLWRVLNLQGVLSQNQIDISSSSQGRKFFESHRRLQHQMLQTKSIRPKTTSSNYRTKMQYISYLQQFNQ